MEVANNGVSSGLTVGQIEAGKAKRREYMRRYMAERYRKHPEKQKAASMRYWARKAAEGK